MTVCVAAIAQGMVLGASDRMLTSGDIEFEPESQKIWEITNSVVLMVAGDFALQAEIVEQLEAAVAERLQAAPDQWLRVEDVATLYAHCYSAARNRRAERELLIPLGLNYESFISRQRELSDAVAPQLARDLIGYEVPRVSAIIAGIDTHPRGFPTPHIWKATDGRLSCADAACFAAIGAGYWHAQSEFMFAGHTRQVDVPTAALTVISAKKRAEVAPGVGRGTDMFAVGHTPGTYALLPRELVDKLEEIDDERRTAEDAAFASAKDRSGEYFRQLLADAARANERQEQPTPSRESPDDEPAAEEEKAEDPGGRPG